MPGFTAVGKRPVAGGTGRKRTGILVVRGGGVTLGALGVTLRSTTQPHATVGGHGAALATTSRYGTRLAATGGGASYDTVLTLRHGSGWATGEGSARVVVLATKATHLVATLGGLATSGGVPTYLGRPGTQHVPEDIRITTDRAGNAVALITQRPARPPVASELPASRAASSAPDRETSRRASGVPTSTLRSAE